jgi:ketosteroid isomerase-like protein
MSDPCKRSDSKAFVVPRFSLVCLMMTALVAPSLRAKEATPRHDDQVRRAVKEFFEALDRLNADALGGLMTEDCVSVIPWPDGVTAIPRSDYLARVRASNANQAGTTTDRASRDLDVRVDGDAAMMTGFTGPADPEGLAGKSPPLTL